EAASTQALWARVEAASGAERVGTAVAVYGALRTVRSMAGRRQGLLRELEAARVEQEQVSERVMWRRRLNLALAFLPLVIIPACALGGGMSSVGYEFGTVLLVIMFLALLAFGVLLLVRLSGDSRVHKADRIRMVELPGAQHHMDQAFRSMDQDLARAGRVGSRPSGRA
ncbi:serine/threonine protein kinase, partial [Nocardiopsis sp. MG754419]|nr:serine/threonine protein kinase [Nocardiopsis sp. MG754419]